MTTTWSPGAVSAVPTPSSVQATIWTRLPSPPWPAGVAHASRPSPIEKPGSAGSSRGALSGWTISPSGSMKNRLSRPNDGSAASWTHTANAVPLVVPAGVERGVDAVEHGRCALRRCAGRAPAPQLERPFPERQILTCRRRPRQARRRRWRDRPSGETIGRKPASASTSSSPLVGVEQGTTFTTGRSSGSMEVSPPTRTAADDPAVRPRGEDAVVILGDGLGPLGPDVPQVDVRTVAFVCRASGEGEPVAVRRIGRGLPDHDQVAGDGDRLRGRRRRRRRRSPGARASPAPRSARRIRPASRSAARTPSGRRLPAASRARRWRWTAVRSRPVAL